MADAAAPEEPNAPKEPPSITAEKPKEEPAPKAEDELLCTFCGLRACWTK